VSKEAIIERVARVINQAKLLHDKYKEYPGGAIDLEKLRVADTLEAAGFFDLLMAAEELSERLSDDPEYGKGHYGAWDVLDSAISRAKGDT